MNDDEADRNAPGPSRISHSEDYEVHYWTDASRVSQERLRGVDVEGDRVCDPLGRSS